MSRTTADITTSAASILLGAGMAANAVLGPLALGIIRVRESPSMAVQLVGGELTSLYVAAPLAVAAGVLWWRRAAAAPAVTFAPAAYALYTYVQFILVPDYSRYAGNNERWFPLYLALILLAWPLLWHSWTQLAARPLVSLGRRASRVVGAILVAINAAFALAWIVSVAAVLSGAPPVEYVEHPTGFWLIRTIDLGFVIPIGLAIGARLLRRDYMATRAACALVAFETLVACAVATMAGRMWITDDPARSVALLGFSVAATLTLAVCYRILAGAVR